MDAYVAVAAKVLVVNRCTSTTVHLDDGRAVRLAIPDELVEPLHEAHNAGARVDFIETYDMVAGSSRMLAWWHDQGMSVIALPASEII